MLQYPKITYLDVEKTGSTYIRSFLEKFADGAPIRTKKHGVLPFWSRPEGVTIISCRDPFAQYLSLYRYGCDNRGGIYQRLVRHAPETEELYDGTLENFSKWLESVLDVPPALKKGLHSDRLMRLDLIGLQTARIFRLGMRAPYLLLRSAKTQDDALAAYDRWKYTDRIVRNESLVSDLLTLVDGALGDHLTDVDAARAFLETHDESAKVNVSKTPFRVTPSDLDASLVQKLEQKERFFFDVLGYRRYS